MKNFALFLFVIALSLPAFAQDDTKEEPQYEMKTYYMVFLKKGPNRNTMDSTTAASVQKAHLENIDRLVNEGKINLAGPFLEDMDLRGIFVMDVASKEEAAELVETDPAIKTGRLVYEIFPWYSAKGACLK